MLKWTPIIPSLSFLTWLHNNPENKRLLWMSMALIILPFAWLKLQYPFPNFMPPDSSSYIEAAASNQSINFWPIGYSKFLQLIAFLSHSHFVLVLTQYLLLYLSILYLLFIVRYYFQPGKWTFRLLLLVCLLNPLLPHISNFVSSDCLFTSLSMLWFTQLIILIHTPSLRLLAVHGLVVFLAIAVRHNGLLYPFISLLFLLFTRWPARNKWISTALIILPLLGWIGYNQQQYDNLTSKVQYSAFAGWQMASNVLYGYAHADTIPTRQVKYKYKKLHKLVHQHFDSLRLLKKRPDEEVYIYYLWNNKAPLRQYLYQQHAQNSTSSSFLKQWASIAPLYASYGRYLLRHRPGAFIRYYLWPNMKNYYSPPAKFMGLYNRGNNKVPLAVSSWFRWTDNTLPARSHTIAIGTYAATLFPMINIAFAGSFIVIICLLGLRNSLFYHKGIFWLVFFAWFCNMIFSVFAAPIELRHQLFPMLFTLVFTIIHVELLLRLKKAAYENAQRADIKTNLQPAIHYSSK